MPWFLRSLIALLTHQIRVLVEHLVERFVAIRAIELAAGTFLSVFHARYKGHPKIRLWDGLAKFFQSCDCPAIAPTCGAPKVRNGRVTPARHQFEASKRQHGRLKLLSNCLLPPSSGCNSVTPVELKHPKIVLRIGIARSSQLAPLRFGRSIVAA